MSEEQRKGGWVDSADLKELKWVDEIWRYPNIQGVQVLNTKPTVKCVLCGTEIQPGVATTTVLWEGVTKIAELTCYNKWQANGANLS